MGDSDLRFKREILGVAILLALASLYVIYPFLDSIILAIAAAYLLRFAHEKLNRRIENDFLSSAVITSSLLGFLALCLYFLVTNTGSIINGVQVLSTSFREAAVNTFDFFEVSESFRTTVLSVVDTLSAEFRSWAISSISALPSIFIDVAIFAVTSVYFYRDGDRITDALMDVVDDLPENERKIFRSLFLSVDSIFRGVFVTQFTVAGITALTTALGFYLISFVTSPIPFIPVWAILVGIAVLLPLIAAFMFYGPISLYYLVAGEPLKGSLILIYGIVVLNILPEVFLRPYVGSRQMDEHPLIIFTGFIAGPLTLGLKGFILGPLLLILTKEFILNYTDLVS